MPRKSTSTVMVPVKGKVMMATPRAKATKVVVVTQSNIKHKRKRKSVRSGLSRGLSTYMKCVVDPFENPPIRLGFDTFVPTSLHTAYQRISVTTNATDGSFDIVMTPNLVNFLLTNVAGANNTPLWVNSFAANYSAINTQIDYSRVVGMALKIFPQIPLTSAPGIISSGVTPRMSTNDMVNFFGPTTSSRQNLPYNEFFMGRTGNTEANMVSWRPTDVSEFIFHDMTQPQINIVSGVITANTSATGIGNLNAGNFDSGGSLIHISGTGLPAGTVLFVEAVCHIECTDSQNSIASDTGDDSNPRVCDDIGVSDMQGAFRTIADLLPSPNQAILAGSSFFGTQIGRAISNYAVRSLAKRVLPHNGDGFVILN
jgi:hypothetical protein